MAVDLNDTHVRYDNTVLDKHVMEENNYTLSHDGVLRNDTYCYIIFDRYNATMYPNGTVHGTHCDVPINGIYIRGGLGIAFGVAFGIMIMLGCVTLRKHGKSYLREDRNFRLVSRRWPWYWFHLSALISILSGFTAIDVDRVYIQGTSLILTNFFYYIMLPTILASIWEMTRHWGSFCERQLSEEDPFRFLHGDRRYKIHLYIPLVFYLFAFLTFFLANLRSWTPIPHGSAEGIAAATDGRFKASAIMAVLAWIVCVVSIGITNYYYQPVARKIPVKIPLCLGLVLIRIGYNIAVAWDYDISPLKQQVPEAFPFCLGYLPVLLIMVVMVIAGYVEKNDDLIIKELRQKRHMKMDDELGISKSAVKMKPMKLPTVDSGMSQSGMSTASTIVDEKR